MSKMAGDSLPERFSESALKYSNKPAVIYRTGGAWKEISYAALAGQVNALAAFLGERGAAKDTKVAIMLENRPEWPVIFFAILCAGAIPVPINFEAPAEEAGNILKDSGSELLFTSKLCLKAQYGFLKAVIDVDTDEFSAALKREPALFCTAKTSRADNLACLLYTSGTTDTAKGVMLTHANLLANCNSLITLGIISANDRLLSVLPLHHIYPLTITAILPLITGCTIIYPASLRPEDLAQATTDLNPTLFIAVPQILRLFHKRIEEQLKHLIFPAGFLLKVTAQCLCALRQSTGINLSKRIFSAIHKRFGRNLRFFVSGGAKLDTRVAGDLYKLGFTIVEGYGLTETSPVLTLNPAAAPRIGSAGKQIPGVEVKIANPNEAGIGEVAARGANVMQGYYKRQDLTDEAIKDGWFYTGDLGYLDKDGYLFLTGRLKEVLVLSSGLKINPEELENIYLAKAPVKQICIFEAPVKKEFAQVLALWAVVQPDIEYFKKYGEINLREIIKYKFDNVSRSLPAHKRLMGFYLTLEDLPHTALGKIKRFAVKNIYTPKIIAPDNRSAGPRPQSAQEARIMESETAKKVVACLRQVCGLTRDISVCDALELDLGIDSLGRVELASCLEKELGIKIKDEAVGQAFTVRELIARVDGIIAAGNASLPREDAQKPQNWQALLSVPPQKQNLDKIDLRPRLFFRITAFIFCSGLYLMFKIFYGLKVKGRENLPPKGPYILYANHASYFDGFLIAASLPYFSRPDVFFVGLRQYFDVALIRNLIKLGRIIPVDFSGHLLEALRSCFYVLKNEKDLCIFPEGVRSCDGEIKDFKNGFGILAKESGVMLVPVLIEGAYEAWPRTSVFPRLHALRVHFAKAINARELESEGLKMGGKDAYGAICLAARQRLKEAKE